MALLKAYGIDPDETWELDFALEDGRFTLEALRREVERGRAALEKEQDGEKRKASETRIAAAEKAIPALEADLAAYEPGSGPVFTVGSIPNGKRAEIQGDELEVFRLPDGKDRIVRDRAWAELVVRWSVRGHRGLRSLKTQKEIPFRSEAVEFAGEQRQLVSRKTLDAYGPIIGRLAVLVLRSQQLDEAEKNG